MKNQHCVILAFICASLSALRAEESDEPSDTFSESEAERKKQTEKGIMDDTFKVYPDPQGLGYFLKAKKAFTRAI